MIVQNIYKGDKPMLRNPYTPGACNIPSHLAGREHLLESATEYLNELKDGGIAIHTIYYGVRGVGKTVLLNKIEEMTNNLDFLYTHVEGDSDIPFVKHIALACQQFLSQMSTIKSIKIKLNKMKSLLCSFQATYSVSAEEQSVSVSLNPDTIDALYTANTGELSYDLTKLFVSMGELAKDCNRPICFFIDEIQSFDKTSMSALISAVHRTNQLNYPIIIVGAGLPTILRLSGDARSYAERLFDFVEIRNLRNEDAVAALTVPANNLAVTIQNEAVDFILDKAGNYPYFIQEYGRIIWRYMDENRFISLEHAKTAYDEYINKIDSSFFGVRYQRSTSAEKKFLFAMSKCEHFPCAIGEVASTMHRPPKSISPLRNNLINKGLLYSPSYGEIDFTVPQFDKFLKRVESGDVRVYSH